IDVARLCDGAREIDTAMAFFLPAVPRAITKVVIAVARLRHPRVEGDETVLERDDGSRELARGARRVLALHGLVVQRLPRVFLQRVVVRARHSADESIRIDRRRAVK